MEIAETERLMLSKKQEEICGLTCQILEMAHEHSFNQYSESRASNVVSSRFSLKYDKMCSCKLKIINKLWLCHLSFEF